MFWKIPQRILWDSLWKGQDICSRAFTVFPSLQLPAQGWHFKRFLSDLVEPLLNPSWIFLCILLPSKFILFLMQPPFAKRVGHSSSSWVLPPLPPSKKIVVAIWLHLRFSPEWSLISFQSVHLIDRVYFPGPRGSPGAALRQKLDVKHPFHVLPGDFLKPSHLLLAFGTKPKREALSIKRLSDWITCYFETCNKCPRPPAPVRVPPELRWLWRLCLGKVPTADVCETANWNLVRVPCVRLRCSA